MLDMQKQINNIVAAMLTIAWASTKQRDVSQDEINAIYKNFGGKKWFQNFVISNWKMI